MIERTLPVASPKQVWNEVWKIVRKDKRNAFLIAILLFISSAAAAVATRLLGAVVDAVAHHDAHRINEIGIGLLACILVAGFVGLAARRKLAKLAERTLVELRSDAFNAAMSLQLDTIERVGTADPLSRLTGDIGNVSDQAHDSLPIAATMSVAILLTLVAMFITSPILGLAAFAGIPVLLVAMKMTIGRIHPMNIVWLAANAEVTRGVHEIGDGASTIRAFNSHKAWRKRFDNAVQLEWELEWPMATLRNILYPFLYVCQTISLITVLTVGYFKYESGSISIGTISAIALFTIQLVAPVTQLFDLIEKFQQAGAALGRVVGLINYSQDSLKVASKRAFPTKSNIDLRNVHFSYESGHEVLHGLDLSINAGERVAIIGVSGAGKSTIAKLIAGIHEPTAGEITIGDVPVANIDNTEGRRAVILVTQESHVFIGTIADNLRLAKPSATDKDLLHVLTTVEAIDWINELPQGIETPVGRNGYQLNLVQAQQLSLARVLLVNPLVVILDEATAGLGTQMARGIERSFGAVLEGRTVLTIAHRLDVAASADRVIVVDKGNIEIGTHEELLTQDGTYANLWNQWLALRS